MRKSLLTPTTDSSSNPVAEWLNLELLASVEVTSEEAEHPIESALSLESGVGWKAAEPGPQIIRLRFDQPQRLRRIFLHFVESGSQRTQEFRLRWSRDSTQSSFEIVRQQWNFSPSGSSSEIEDYRVDLTDVAMLELMIMPDMSGGPAQASLLKMRIA